MQIKRIRTYWENDFEDDKEKAKIVQADSSYCENCGHRQWLYGKEKYICQFCGVMVFKNDKVKFEHRLKEAIKKEKRKDGKDIN